MSRRMIGIFVLAALLAVPALALGLPRPTGTPSSGTSEVFKETFTVSSTSSSGVLTTTTLMSNRSYRFAVSGTWKHSVAPNAFADARWTTTDNWLTCTQLGRGLQIDTTKYGDTASDLGCNRKDHTYSIIVPGRDRRETVKIFDENYSDNSGFLTVSLYEQSTVTYTYQLNNVVGVPSPLPQPGATLTVPAMTVSPGSVPGVGIPGTIIPGVGIPTLGSLTYSYKTANQYCVSLQLGSNPATELGCVFDESRLLPNGQTNIGGGTVVAPTTISPTGIGGSGLPGATVPSQVVGVGIPAGSSVSVTLTWKADTTKLIRVASTTGNTELWAPFSPTASATWFVTADVPATLSWVVNDPSGNQVAPPQTITIPGLGQVIEAAFASRAAGR